MNVDPKVLSKIKKCLALSGSSEPHEAAAAAALRHAQALMRQHNVTASEIELSELGEASFEGYTISKIRRWEAVLVGSVATAFGCRTAFAAGNGRVPGRYSFLGLKYQVELAAYTAQVLYRQCLRARARRSSTGNFQAASIARRRPSARTTSASGGR